MVPQKSPKTIEYLCLTSITNEIPSYDKSDKFVTKINGQKAFLRYLVNLMRESVNTNIINFSTSGVAEKTTLQLVVREKTSLKDSQSRKDDGSSRFTGSSSY